MYILFFKFYLILIFNIFCVLCWSVEKYALISGEVCVLPQYERSGILTFIFFAFLYCYLYFVSVEYSVIIENNNNK